MIAFVALLALQALTSVPLADPFAFFQPSLTITADDRRQLDRGEPIARVLPGNGLEVAVFAAVRVDVDGDRRLESGEPPVVASGSP